MSGNSPARLLAPLALVLAALALIVVITSGGEDPASTSGSGAEPTATATSTPEATREPREDRSDEPEAGEATTYTVQSGDSPSSIAESEDVSVEALLEANPDVDPNALSVGDELEIPSG